jgi:hypothetical protein
MLSWVEGPGESTDAMAIRLTGRAVALIGGGFGAAAMAATDPDLLVDGDSGGGPAGVKAGVIEEPDTPLGLGAIVGPEDVGCGKDSDGDGEGDAAIFLLGP